MYSHYLLQLKRFLCAIILVTIFSLFSCEGSYSEISKHPMPNFSYHSVSSGKVVHTDKLKVGCLVLVGSTSDIDSLFIQMINDFEEIVTNAALEKIYLASSNSGITAGEFSIVNNKEVRQVFDSSFADLKLLFFKEGKLFYGLYDVPKDYSVAFHVLGEMTGFPRSSGITPYANDVKDNFLGKSFKDIYSTEEVHLSAPSLIVVVDDLGFVHDREKGMLPVIISTASQKKLLPLMIVVSESFLSADLQMLSSFEIPSLVSLVHISNTNQEFQNFYRMIKSRNFQRETNVLMKFDVDGLCRRIDTFMLITTFKENL